MVAPQRTVRRLAFVVGVPLAVVSTLVVLQPMDGSLGWLASQTAGREDTVYAAGYSDAAFRKVSEGMTEREVAELLGEPLEMYSVEPDLVGWRYARSADDSSYHVRAILFRDGRVVEVFCEFYVD